MRKFTALNKNIRREFKHSIARFISIAILLFVGAYVLIGLKSSGPDMRMTGMDFFHTYKLADAEVTAPQGISQGDLNFLQQQKGIKKVEPRHQVDAVIKGSDQAYQLNSKVKTMSLFKAVRGRLPQKIDEIALNDFNQDHYKIGQTITFVDENGKSPEGLKRNTFKIVGFVRSPDYLNRTNHGSTTIGNGQLRGYGVVTSQAFTLKNYQLAALRFNNTQGKAAFSKAFDDAATKSINRLEPKLNRRAQTYQKKLKESVQKQKTQLETQREKLQQGMAQLKSQLAQVPKSSPQFTQGTSQLQKLETSLAQITAGLTQLNKQQNNLNLLTFNVKTRAEFSNGYSLVGDAGDRLDVLANIFPIIFFVIAIFVSVTTMSRMVEEKRIEIGTMRALGYDKPAVMREFVSYGLTASLIGSVLGVVAGTYTLPAIVVRAYNGSNVITNMTLKPTWIWILVALLLGVLCTVIPAIWAAENTLREKTAALLQAKPPKKGTRILLERVSFIWRRLSFNHKITFRNLFRFKSRAFMTIFGILGCTSLLIIGFVLRHSIEGTVTNQFERISRYQILSIFDPKSNQQDLTDYQNVLQKDAAIKSTIALTTDSLTIKPANSDNTQTVTMMVPQQPKKMNDYLLLADINTKKPLTIKSNGAIISRKLAQLTNAKVGSKLTFKDATGQKRQIKIGAIANIYVGHYVVLSKDQYQKVYGRKAVPNNNLIKTKDTSTGGMDKVAQKLTSQKATQRVDSLNVSKHTMDQMLSSLNLVVLIILIISLSLAFVVSYTLTNINIAERIRELSTIKVLGFYPFEVGMYIYRENLLLTLIGIIIGCFTGTYLHGFVMKTVAPDLIYLDTSIAWWNYALSAGLTILFSMIVMLFMSRKINRVDMLDALKAVD